MNKSDERKLDDKDILQIDGGIITGLLVFITLTSLFVSGAFSKTIGIIITAGVMFPFAISAIMVLSKHVDTNTRLQKLLRIKKLIEKLREKYSQYARNATFFGFWYLMGAIVILFFFNLLSLFNPEWPLFIPNSTMIKACENDKEGHHFGLNSKTKCDKIKQGSLYEECVMKSMPNIMGCSKFMID